ncbi:M14 family metallopeptidase [soil metagenome]
MRLNLLGVSLCASLLLSVSCAGPRPMERGPSATMENAGSLPQTRAERTGFLETTRYEEIIDFLQVLDHASSEMHLTYFGYSHEGRALPLMVWGNDDPAPEAVIATGKTRVFLQANIHAGEVEGKEALLILLREMADGRHAGWADSLVILVAPIYNADGNERVNLFNRPRQHGPLAGMGQRPNAQGFDLNRDHMKLDSPEAHALTSFLTRYDPHVAVDLHATNGTYHAYHLTYSPPLNPNTHPDIVSILREDWLPGIRDRVRADRGWEMYYYGNVPQAESPWAAPSGAERGWYTFDHRPRFSNNYVGLRNRFAILSEAYAHLPFQERIQVTTVFVREIVDYAAHNAGSIRAVTEAADRTSIIGQQMAVRSDFSRSPSPVEILMGEVREERNPFSGEIILRRVDTVRREMMPEFGTFAATEREIVPAVYLIPADLTNVIFKLGAHGVAMERLTADRTLEEEQFHIHTSSSSETAFQQHHERTLTGVYRAATRRIPAGTVVVPMNQPLARLAFYLLEPRSDDGFVNWNVLDAQMDGATIYPITRAHIW